MWGGLHEISCSPNVFTSDSIRSLYSTRNIICTSHPCLLLSLTRWAIMYVSVGDGEKGKKTCHTSDYIYGYKP